MDFSRFIPNMIDILEEYWQVFLFTGLKNTLLLTVISVALGTLLGTVVAMGKMSKFAPLRQTTFTPSPSVTTPVSRILIAV